MIMSVFTALPARALNTLAATPVASGTPRIVTFTSEVSWAMPVITASSIISQASLTYVPSASENVVMVCRDSSSVASISCSSSACAYGEACRSLIIRSS